MARPIRVEYEGAVYHVTLRGNERRVVMYLRLIGRHFIKVVGIAFFAPWPPNSCANMAVISNKNWEPY